MSGPERIYLEPECCIDPGTGRLWCEDDVFECEDGKHAVEYVRADIAAQTERAAVVAWLRSRKWPVNTRLCKDLADAIERGDHVTAIPLEGRGNG
jgi:hypothetical protein